jgi:AcrR family transcriptional regulator
VIAAAREIAEREGADGLSLRRLASALGVAPNAIYSHVPSKTALLDEVLEDIRGDIEIPDLETGDWRDALVALMTSSRRVVAAHPTLIPLFLGRPARGRNGRRLGEAALALLERGAIEGERAVEALRALLVFTLGFAAFEAPRRDDPDPEGRRAASEAAFAADAELPRTRAAAPVLARNADDRTFERGLRWLIAGIQTS